MIVLLAPAKTFQQTDFYTYEQTEPLFQSETNDLVCLLRDYTAKGLSELMRMSAALGEENAERFRSFEEQFTHPTLALFHGAMYKPMNVEQWTKKEWDYAQQHVRILSGLYGMLRPMDAMRPYRLEMGTILPNEKGANLYAFWQATLTNALQAQLKEQQEDTVINLASGEYSKAVSLKDIKTNHRVIDIAFKEQTEKGYRTIGTYSKKARGEMIRYIVEQKITVPEDIKKFQRDGYVFSEEWSKESSWVFVRG